MPKPLLHHPANSGEPSRGRKIQWMPKDVGSDMPYEREWSLADEAINLLRAAKMNPLGVIDTQRGTRSV